MGEWKRQVEGLPDGAREIVAFACRRMVHSYKPVLLSVLLECLPGPVAPVDRVAHGSLAFYQDRARGGLPVERRGCAFVTESGLDPRVCHVTAHDLLRLVFASAGLISVARSAGGFEAAVGWGAFEAVGAKEAALRVLAGRLARYYEASELRGDAVYGRAEGGSVGEADPLVPPVPAPNAGHDMR